MKNKRIPSVELLESRQLLSVAAGVEEKQIKDIPCSEISESIKDTLETWTLFGTNTAFCMAGNILGAAVGHQLGSYHEFKFKLTDRDVGVTVGSCILEGMVVTGLVGPELGSVEGIIYISGLNALMGGGLAFVRSS